MEGERIRVLIAKVGLDGHDRGSLIVTQALRDAGMEVIYSGLKNTPENVVASAIQEDVDVLGVSILSGAHMVLIPEIMELLKENEAGDIIVLVGGVMPPTDVPKLRSLGVDNVFLPGTKISEIVKYVTERVAQKRKA
ncbi:MAG: cobalamin B12-binding domain-containing protein [Thermodesulfobacteriota bacterium]